MSNKKLNKLFKTNIDIIRLKEYTSYYSSKYKMPMLVIENLKAAINKPNVKFIRAEIDDPFRKYNTKQNNPDQYSVEDYQLMKKYGLSPGHNAPAGHHKSSMETWGTTFYHINMTPQDIVLNAGVWLILEQWCYYIAKNPSLKKLYILTGNIPNNKTTKIESLDVNIPTFMYKIVIATSKKKSNNIYIACFLYPNKPIIPNNNTNDLENYLIDIDKLSDICKLDINSIIKFIIKKFKIDKTKLTKKNTITNKYTFKKNTDNNFVFLGDILKGGIHFDLSPMLKKSLINAHYFGLLINSKTLDELETHWNDYIEKNKKQKLNRSLEYHKEYYELAKQRIISNNTEFMQPN
jgi:DNA/RNA endonuclease G (NUC1)